MIIQVVMSSHRCWAVLATVILLCNNAVLSALDPSVAADIDAQSPSVAAVVRSMSSRFKGQAFDRLAGETHKPP